MNAKGIWIAFGIGVAAGATVALLYAPQSGERTRRQLRKGIDDAGDYLEDAADYLKGRADKVAKESQKLYKRTRSQVEDAIDTAGDAVNAAVKSVQTLM
ncbi:YtxH domain-containing protein [Terriglobus albidus]|uniref:YtxH domain-containing protein n=1 Tax=Terriglobus albidus TaxID=1592106 RepID=A0A5B9EDE6_9BACT|nr:YtxH domain-containing protein [Terriglobus albidus]QEE28770.1 YtxH domain-containing protein [Terriglobus albidus]